MTEAQHLADALQGLLTRADSGWFTPVSIAIAGLTAAQAAAIPREGFNSIWSVVNHMCFWHKVLLLRLEGRAVDRQALGAENGWPPAGEPADEQAWQAACRQLTSVNEEVAARIAQLQNDELDQPIAPGRARCYQAIQGLIAHNSYHTCEIISLRHLLGLWLERT